MNHRDHTFKCVVWPDDCDEDQSVTYNKITLDVLSLIAYLPSLDERVPAPALHVHTVYGQYVLCNMNMQQMRELRESAANVERQRNYFAISAN